MYRLGNGRQNFESVILSEPALTFRGRVEGPLLLRDLTSNLRIAHFAQDRGPLGSGRRENVRWQPAPRLISQKCERRRFLRVGGESELVAGADAHLQRRKLLPDHPHQRCVLCSTAGDDEFPKTQRRLYQRQHKLAHGDDDGARRERGGGGDKVILVGTPAQAQELAHELAAELLAASGLGRFLPEERMPEHLLQHAFDWLTTRGESSVAVVGAAEQTLGHSVDHHIGRARVEGDDMFWLCAWWNRGEVADSPKILHDTPIAALAVENVIEEGNQGRTFAAYGHVCGTEIRDHGHAELCRDDGRFTRLPCARDVTAEEWLGLALVVERLAMTADQFAFQPGPALRGTDRIGIEFAEQKIQAREIRNAGRAGVHGCENSATHIVRVRKLIVRQKLQARAEATTLDTHQRDIDAVGGGAAHDTGHDHEETSLATMVWARTSSLNSHISRRNRSTVFCDGAGDGRAFNARDFFFTARTRRDFSAMRQENFLSLSACLYTASKARHTLSSFWQTRNMSAPARSVSTAASSMEAAASTPPISRSSVMMSPR